MSQIFDVIDCNRTDVICHTYIWTPESAHCTVQCKDNRRESFLKSILNSIWVRGSMEYRSMEWGWIWVGHDFLNRFPQHIQKSRFHLGLFQKLDMNLLFVLKVAVARYRWEKKKWRQWAVRDELEMELGCELSCTLRTLKLGSVNTAPWRCKRTVEEP